MLAHRGSTVGGDLKQIPINRFIPLATSLITLATTAAVTYSVLIPAVELWRYALRSADQTHTVVAVLATLGYLPLHVRHVYYAAQGIRPPKATWTVAAMAAVIVGVLPYLGAFWLGQFHALAVSVLIVLRPAWSLVLFGGIVAAQTPLAIVLNHPEMAPFFTIAGALKGLPVFLLIWLIGAVRRLRAARLALADKAVARERLRIDEDLRRTVGAALELIVEQGERAGELTLRDIPAARAELGALVRGSRQALADARRLIRGYQHTSLSAEFHTAAALLSARGVESRLVLPDGDLTDTVDATLRSKLRADIARLLTDDTVRRSVIRVTRHNGQLQLEASAESGTGGTCRAAGDGDGTSERGGADAAAGPP